MISLAYRYFKNQRSTISISLKYSEKTTTPDYFKNLRKSTVFMTEPLKKQAVFHGHLFEFYNKSLRTVIIHRNKFFGSFENHGYKPCELS